MSESRARNSFFVAFGILCSRIAGLIRQRVFSHYFGLTAPADAFMAAFRIPNFLNNLFGEGALSASFIPVYASLVARGERAEADRVAGAVASLLALSVSLIVLVGVVATPLLIDAIAPGFTGETRELTIVLVRILFPGAGLMVMSAWCLGVLNSHHRFFVLLCGVGGVERGHDCDARAVRWRTSVAATGEDSGLGVGRGQWPDVPRSAADRHEARAGSPVGVGYRLGSRSLRRPQFRSRLRQPRRGPVERVYRHADREPVADRRGGRIAQRANDRAAAGELVRYVRVRSGAPGHVECRRRGAAGALALQGRLDSGLRQIAFFVIPSAMAFLALGDVIAAALFQTGRFTHEDAIYVWAILAGSAVGLLASTLGRLYSSTYYALRDTRTPLNYAVIRVILTTVLGYLCAIPLPRWLGLNPMWGAAGLTSSAGVAGWVEMFLLRSSLNRRIGRTGLAPAFVAALWLAAGLGAAVGWGVKLRMPSAHPIVTAIAVLGAYGVVFRGCRIRAARAGSADGAAAPAETVEPLGRPDPSAPLRASPPTRLGLNNRFSIA